MNVNARPAMALVLYLITTIGSERASSSHLHLFFFSLHQLVASGGLEMLRRIVARSMVGKSDDAQIFWWSFFQSANHIRALKRVASYIKALWRWKYSDVSFDVFRCSKIAKDVRRKIGS
jgi:hypothetical protein